MVSIVNKYFLPVSGTLAMVALSMSIVAEEIDSSAFSMQIMDVFTITDRGTVMTGQVKSGSISAGETVCIPLTNGEIAPSTIESIEMHRKQLAFSLPKPVRDAIGLQRVKSLEVHERTGKALRGRVSFTHGAEVPSNGFTNLRALGEGLIEELAHQHG